MKNFLRTVPVFLAVFLIAGCQKQGELTGTKANLSVDKTSISIGADGGSEPISITSNSYWDLTAEAADGDPVAWITFSKKNGSGNAVVEVKVAANIKTEPREAVVIVSSSSAGIEPIEIPVKQEAGEVSISTGYSFPICQTIDIDSPDSRQLVNAAIAGTECLFKDGMVLSCAGEGITVRLECPSHTQPSKGTDEDKAIHRSIRFDDLKQGESILLAIPVKDALSGDLRLMFGARAASFTKEGWSYYWGADGENWKKIEITNATTPGSDAVWNNILFTIPAAEAIPAGGTLHFKFTADAERSKNYVCISNAICIFPAEAEKSSLPPMDDDKMAFSNGFDALVNAGGSYPQFLPMCFMASATSSYASNYTNFNDHWSPEGAYEEISSATGCYERPGFLQVGYYDESLWTRQCIGTYKILIGERLKQMGVSSADASLSLKVGLYKDCRGYDPLAKVTVTAGDKAEILPTVVGEMKEFTVNLEKLTQESEIAISTPKLSEEELAALGRNSNLQDYRFYIDDVKVLLTTIHAKGASGNGGNEDFEGGDSYKW